MINLSFNVDINCLEVGSDLTGSCIWIPDTQNQEKSPTTLTIGWRTDGKGDKDEEIIYKTELKSSVRTYFQCRIPVAGPVSYNGQLLKIIWEITVFTSNLLIFSETLKTQVIHVIPRQKR
jgi:hypothetical protein